jgi:uncharacterized protein (TIGR03437 family)
MRRLCPLLLLLLLGLACGDPSGPRIEALLPASAAPGDVVDVVGERFEGRQRSVAFGGRSAEVLFWQPQRARVRVPSGLAGSTNVVVTIDGRPSNPQSFTVGDSGDAGP